MRGWYFNSQGNWRLFYASFLTGLFTLLACSISPRSSTILLQHSIWRTQIATGQMICRCRVPRGSTTPAVIAHGWWSQSISRFLKVLTSCQRCSCRTEHIYAYLRRKHTQRTHADTYTPRRHAHDNIRHRSWISASHLRARVFYLPLPSISSLCIHRYYCGG